MTHLYDFCDNSRQQQQNNVSELLQYRLEKQQKTSFEKRFTLSSLNTSLEIPSLTYTLTGSVSPLIEDEVTLILQYIPSYGIIRSLPVSINKNTLTRSIEISKKDTMIEAGINKYHLQVKKKEEILASLPLQINSHAQEITLGEYTIYLDPSYRIDGQEIVEKIPSFDGHEVSQLKFGCFTNTAPKILIKTSIEYRSIDGCFQYDEVLAKILLFKESKFSTNDTRSFTISTLAGEIVYEDFPLFRQYFGQWYQNFLSYEYTGETLGIYETLPGNYGNNFHYQRLGGGNGRILFELHYDSIGSIWMRNTKESLLLRLYKYNDHLQEIRHPGLSSQYSASTYQQPAYKKSLVYPLSGYTIDIPSFLQPTRKLSFAIDQHSIVIHDGIKDISYNLSDLSKIQDIKDHKTINNQGNCNIIETKIISAQGKELVHGPQQTYFLIAKHIGNYIVKTHRKDRDLEINHYGDNISIAINQELGNLQTGNNNYDISFSDKNGIVLCNRKLNLFIQ